MHTERWSTGERGLDLAVHRWPGEGTPALVLHGLLDHGAAWHDVARALKRPVIAPDQRGHGQSDHVGRGGFYHFWDYVADLQGIVAHIGQPIDLVGHSMGGAVAALFAGCQPDAVRKMVLIEGLGPPSGADQVVANARSFLRAMAKPPSHRPLRDLDEAAQRLRAHLPKLGEADAKRIAAHQIEAVEGGQRWRWDPLHRARSPFPFLPSLFAHFLREIQAPVLLIEGGESHFHIEDADERVAAISNATRVVLPDAGHSPHIDAPRALARLIEDFLS